MNLCIVCPHTREEHEERYDQCWCIPCNSTEIAGPCSYMFMARHEFMPLRPDDTSPWAECKRCKLSAKAEAHNLSSQ